MSSLVPELETNNPNTNISKTTPRRKWFICRMISVVCKSIYTMVFSVYGDSYGYRAVTLVQNFVYELGKVFNKVTSDDPKKVFYEYNDIVSREIKGMVQTIVSIILQQGLGDKQNDQEVKKVKGGIYLEEIPVIGIIPKQIGRFKSILEQFLPIGKGNNDKDKDNFNRPSSSKQTKVGEAERVLVINQIKEALLPRNIISTVSKILSRKLGYSKQY